MAGAKNQAWRLECNFARGGKTHRAGEVLSDLTAADLETLGDMAVPVKPKAGAAAKPGDNVLPLPPSNLNDEQREVCADVEILIRGGLTEAAAIKEVRLAKPELPPAKTIKAWLKVFRAAEAAGAGDAGAGDEPPATAG